MDEVEFLDVPTFLRKFEQRAAGLMWLLGAGASRASGIKTAGDMIWDFKSRLYRSDRKIPASAVSDLGDNQIRRLLQNFFDVSGTFPSLDSEDEYAHYFEATYPAAQDRRRYIDDMMRGAKPGYGHMALAHLLKLDLARIIWTTNFDRVIEDAVGTVMGTGSQITVGDLGEPQRVRTAYSQQRWPIYGKLHGDFQSENLKNTASELAEQDAGMRDILIDTCRNQGLIVAGYSGRDSSVMEALQRAINDGSGFPNGLFWVVRGQDNIYEGVSRLIEAAKAAGVDAAFVQAESFDEFLSDIVRYHPATEKLLITLDDKRSLAPRKIDLSARSPCDPFVRMNAVPVLEYPKTCRLIDCDIGGAREIQERIATAESRLVASRINKGVLAFGDDTEIKRVFADHNVRSLDTHSIIADRLTFESGERSLLRDALFQSLKAHCGLNLAAERHRHIFRADGGHANFDLAPLAKATGRLSGVVPKTDVPWAEACRIRLDFRLGRLWLLLNPFVIIDNAEDTPEVTMQAGKEFVRERRAKRYNSQSNAILDGWIQAIFGERRKPVSLGLDGGTGIGASFEISPVTGYSGLSR
ncbi:MAG: SIR2 family protein [Sphingorhabdus sp.]